MHLSAPDRGNERPTVTLADIEPLPFPEADERLSEQVDDVVYSEETSPT